MLCPKCQTENPDKNIICSNCGCNLEKHRRNQEKVKKAEDKVFNFLKKFKVILISIVAVVLALFFAYNMISDFTSPERAAENFVDTLKSEKYEKAIKLLNIEDSEFITAEKFGNAIHKEYPELTDKHYRVIVYAKYDEELTHFDDGEALYEVKWELKNKKDDDLDEIENSDRNYFLLKVSKSEDKSMLIFPKYDISFLYSDVILNPTVAVPKGSKVFVNSKEIKTPPKESMHYDFMGDVYELGTMLEGDYEITVKGPTHKDVTEKIHIDDDNCFEIKLSHYEPFGGKDALVKQSKDLLTKLTNGMIKGASFSSLKIPVYVESGSSNHVKDYYNHTMGYFENTQKIEGVYCSDSDSVSDGSFLIELSYDTVEDGLKRRVETKFFYVLNNGKWIITDIDDNRFSLRF